MLSPIQEDQFSCPYEWMTKLDFIKDENKKITGF